MTDRNDFAAMSDDELLVVLGEALAATDPVPPAVHEYAVAGFGWRTIDADLAELVFDSAVAELAGVRGAEETREITFRAPGIEIEVVVLTEDTRRIVGQLVPPQQAVIELRSVDGSVRRVESDDLGRFSVTDVPTGNVSLRCILDDDQTVQTDWVIF